MRQLEPFKKAIVGVFSLLVIFIAGTQGAHAFSPLDSIAGAMVAYLNSLVGAAIGFLAGILFGAASWLVGFTIDLNTDLAESSVIANGHEIVLSLANLGIVVAIIAVAFMIMLRKAEAKLLIKLVTVALLINFGFYIVTNIFIKPVDNITRTINDAINIGPAGFAGAFSGVFRNDNFINPVTPEAVRKIAEGEGEAGGFIGGLADGLVGMMFLFITTIIGVGSLLAFAGMLLIRYVALSILIIVLPIAILAWAFPDLKIPGGNPWSVWTEHFFRWLFFAPIGLFFMWLAISIIVDTGGAGSVLKATDGTEAGFFVAIGNMVVVVGFLLGGILMADKMSITGAGYAMKTAKKGGEWAQKKTKETGVRTGTWALRTGGGRSVTKAAQKFGQRNKFTRAVTAPLMIRQLGQAASSARQKGEAIYNESKKKVDEKSLEEQGNSFPSASAPEKLAITINFKRERSGAHSELDKARDKRDKAKDKEEKAITAGDDTKVEEARRAIENAEKEIEGAEKRIEKITDIIDGLPKGSATVENTIDKLERLYGQHETRASKN